MMRLQDPLRILLSSLALWSANAAAEGAVAAPQPVRVATGDALPEYVPPRQMVTGNIRTFGSPMFNMVALWGAAFQKYHPGVTFSHKLNAAAAIPSLYTEVADIGASGREPVLTEYFSFYETFKYLPTEIAVASGAYDVKGGSYGLVVYVHKDNPLARLTMKQLDGIFGSERTGGYVNFKWMPHAARGAEQDIRTWGKLGLKGEWANKPIQTYGYALTGMTVVFQQKVFEGGDKWNPNYRQYIETETKQVGDPSLTIDQMLTDLSKDRYGIGWTGLWQTKKFPDLKPIALAASENGPFYAPTRENFQRLDYPLQRNVYLFVNRRPGQELEPRIKEFVKFVLSRQGQELVQQSNVYLPLPPAYAAEQMKKLD